MKYQLLGTGTLLVAVALGGTARGADNAAAATTAPSPATAADLQAQIQHLQSELDAIKQRQAAPTESTAPATTATPADTTADAVEADAAKRGAAAPAMDMTGITAGYIPNKGFVISSEDGNFVFHPWAYLHARYAANYRENAKNFNTESATDAGFEIARLKLIFDGNMFTPDLTYQFIWNTVKSGGNLSMNDAWARYHFHDTPFAIQGGQIRNPLDHEQIMFATQTMTVDRSIVDDVFANGEGIVQGVAVSYGYDQPGALRAQAALTHGLRNNNTSFQDFPVTNANWGAAARVDWKLMGDWDAYNRFTALNNKHDLLVIGAAADYTEAGDTGALLHVVDAQYTLPSGLSIYGAYLGRYTKNNGGAPGTNGGSTTFAPTPYTYDATGRIMVSYLFNQHFEPYLRYEYIQFDAKGLPSTVASTTIHDITLGANYYFYGQRAKLSANVIYLPNGCPINDNTVNDILANPNGGNQVVFQAQFQLII
jgi:hypothetical protein